jgi:hypothetical protein
MRFDLTASGVPRYRLPSGEETPDKPLASATTVNKTAYYRELGHRER